MPKRYDKLLSKLSKKPLSLNEFEAMLSQIGGLFSNKEIELELIKESGIPLVFTLNKVYLRTTITPFLEDKFCIVDIETNGHNPHIHQPIEIGAILYQNGRIIDTFSSLIYADALPQYISKITNITLLDLKNAPKIHQVLESFKLFLSDSIFVAHNVNFDFDFLSQYYHHIGFGYLYNPKLCTIKLAQKIIHLPKYSLEFLNNYFNINQTCLHRGSNDALVTLEILKIIFKHIPKLVFSSYDLLEYQKQ